MRFFINILKKIPSMQVPKIWLKMNVNEKCIWIIQSLVSYKN